MTQEDNAFEGDEFHDFSAIKKYFEEPMLVVSALVFLLAIAKNIITSSDLGIMATPMGRISIYFIGSLLLGLLSLYFIYIYFRKAEKKEYRLILVTLLIFSTSVFIWYADQKGGVGARDLNVMAVVSATFLLFYALTFHKIMKVSTALVTAIFLSTLLTHVISAYPVQGVSGSGRYLDALDPYYYYRHANTIVKTGFVPEKETLVYPTDMPSFADRRYMVSVLMASIAILLQPLGVTVHDVAMIYAGVFAAFSSIVMYLLMRELFSEYKPYNEAAAILAAFMLIFSPAFAAKAIASNCEDDALGMFLLIASYFLFILAYRKKDIGISVIAGFSFLLLNMSWSGYTFAFLVLAIFAFGYPLINFIQDIYLYIFHNQKTIGRGYIEHIPYFVIPVFIGSLSFLVLHAQGDIPAFNRGDIATYNLIAFGAAIFFSFLFEVLRIRLSGEILSDEKGLGNRINNFLQKNAYLIFGVFVLGGILFLISVMDPVKIGEYAVYVIAGAKQKGIIGMTTAEQNPLCSSIFTEKCFMNVYNGFGITAVFSVFSIFILLYYTFASKRNLGPIFILLWSLPMIWGVVNKSQYQFTASVPIIALGSTFALLLVMKRSEWETLRIIPTILIIILPFALTFETNTPLVGAFGGTMPIDRGTIPGDIVRWYPALEWIGEQPENTTILTWWDYGHWITAISDRTSIADNTKARRFIVQDLARFHVLEENETEALKLARKYNATHVVIDYTMIGKSGAPHFIATSNLTAPVDDPDRLGEHMSYGACTFSPKNSVLKPRLVSNNDGGLVEKRNVVFTCGVGGKPEDYIAAINFEIIKDKRGERISDIKVSPIVRVGDQYRVDTEVSWSVWQKEKHASILGVHPLKRILSDVIAYNDNPGLYNSYVKYSPPNRNLVYVPAKFNNYMMTRLYLGDYLKEYQEIGLADESIRPLKHFELVEEFRGTDLEAFATGRDRSYLGYVKAWRINYPENITAP